ncbi:tetraacyldisaccharide 4'-kinase [Sediminitomix flava]|uniref:Tetraacyldisaccharide 4'-kinase n=1 Tax=Sediminitomix flava TaxID=379075 RepID=A0A315ZBK4_SEDFL|nr:tetraacyldisaccharide 4'-kinase [Sediminitomix flava]PWJ42168.1 lipid-A-disaccharide kinase [Sediminitomix flava]
MNNVLKTVLRPLGGLYGGIMSFRNFLYKKNIFRASQFDLKIISVGNLSVGGTGKTPHVELLVSLFEDEYNLGILSRGYGRRTKGFLLANEHPTAQEIGDEPAQYQSKFGEKHVVAVGEERAMAIPQMLYQHENINMIILDDAFQHRAVDRDVNIMLTEFQRPFYDDFIMPAGRLREKRIGASRADIVIITKCPADLSKTQAAQMSTEVQRYAGEDTPVFFSSIKYGKLKSVQNHNETLDWADKTYLLTGIANANPMKEYISHYSQIIHHDEKADHFHYSEFRVEKILERFEKETSGNGMIVTTEKDMVKLTNPSILELLKGKSIAYLPIEIDILFDKKDELKSEITKKL